MVASYGVPTPNERKALWFLAIVALSGSAVRLTRSSHPPPTSAEAKALERQLRRVDSVRDARGADREKRARQTPSKARRAEPDSEPRPSEAERGAPKTVIDLDRASVAE